jgi:hypothetical protein
MHRFVNNHLIDDFDEIKHIIGIQVSQRNANRSEIENRQKYRYS